MTPPTKNANDIRPQTAHTSICSDADIFQIRQYDTAQTIAAGIRTLSVAQNTLLGLPAEMLDMILAYLTFIDLSRLRGASRHLRLLISPFLLTKTIQDFDANLHSPTSLANYHPQHRLALLSHQSHPCYLCLRLLPQRLFPFDNIIITPFNTLYPCDLKNHLSKLAKATSPDPCTFHGVFCKLLCTDCIVDHPAYLALEHIGRRWMDAEMGYKLRCVRCGEVRFYSVWGGGLCRPEGRMREVGVCFGCWEEGGEWDVGGFLEGKGEGEQEGEQEGRGF